MNRFNKPQNSTYFQLLLLLMAFCWVGPATATHLVGGHITYNHLGGNSYEVVLRIYRDCNPNTVRMPDSTKLEIRSTVGSIFSLDVYLQRDTILPHNLDTNRCIIVPPGVCIEYADFRDTVFLPPLAGGYTMSYSACCRNALIVNIQGALSSRYVYDVKIPSLDSIGNNSPRFINPPPVLLCLYEPLNIALNTVDLDGDSLSFQLCDIYGYDASGVVPITFLPPYTSSYPMAASPPFSINPVTGLITGTPTQVGHYVLGICVTDYRNNVPLSTVRLDYQFNVTPCTKIKADILTQAEDSTLFCAGFNMNFTSQSTGATSYLWDFGDTTTTLDISNKKNTSYQYSGPGLYTVTLIADPGSRCSDTTTAVFEITDQLQPGFVGIGTYCFREQPMQLGIGRSYPAGSLYKWDFGPTASITTSTLETPPPVSFPTGGTYPIKLSVRFGKCTYEFYDTLKIREELISGIIDPAQDSTMGCSGLTVRFVSKSKGNPSSQKWDFGDRATLADTANTDTAFYTFPKAGFYMVSLVAMQEGGCKDSSSFLMEVFPELKPQISKAGIYCFEAQEVDFEATGTYPQGTDFTWQFGPLASSKTVNNPSAPNMSWQQPGTYVVSLTTTKAHCTKTVFDTVSIPRWSVPVDAGPDTTINYRDLLELYGSAANQHYWYSNRPMSITNPFGRRTTVDIPAAGDSVKIYLKVTDINGCQGLDSLTVYVKSDDTDQGYNILTPNGDGRNDYLDLSRFMFGDCEFTVFNRWGSEVYHAEKYFNDWAGVDNQGRKLPDGTYYYILFCDRQMAAKGPITIIASDRK